MNVLNHKFEAFFSISVSGVNHEICLDTYNRFKYLVKALDWGDMIIQESKNARKGPVLKRSIMIRFTDYPEDIIAFREIIDRTIFRINNFGEGVCSAELYRASVLRSERFSDFID